jgi:hypothetical protein
MGAFNFIQEGQFIKRGEILRKKQAMSDLDSKLTTEESKNEDMTIDTTIYIESQKQDEKKIHLYC